MITNLDFSHERDLNIDALVKRVESMFPNFDEKLIRNAYKFADEAHRGQKRSSGEDYIIHPLNVAATLIKLKMDQESIVAGLLHDVVEDCDASPEDIEKKFGKDISQIVIGLTKISKIKFRTKEESQAENFRKMVVAMAKDIRVIIVKLADRMHNMRTLQYVSETKQNKVAQETLDIFVPLASRLGINSVKAELEDLCLRFLHPEIYYRLAEKVAMKKSEREKYIRTVSKDIEGKLSEYGVKCEVYGRSKHFYSIYKKMNNRGVDFEQIQDILAFRLIVNNITECYKALGIIHSSYKPVPGRFKDYIAIPKVNNYQSLHTSVIGPKANRLEIQIRTFDMHEVAETGIAAHWKYKESKGKKSQSKLDWVQELLEFNQSLKNNTEFMNIVKNDLDIGGVFVFTPKGDVVELSYGATPLDFAYSVHTEVGNRCVGAKINGKIVPLKYRLRSGDQVDILTSKTQTPSKDWLHIVKSTRAKTKIKQYLLKAEREKNREIGINIIGKMLRTFSTSVKTLKKSGEFEKATQRFKAKGEDDFYVMVGAGKVSTEDLIENIPSLSEYKDQSKEKVKEFSTYFEKVSRTAKRTSNKDNAVIVDGADDVLVRMAKCCNPIPGDPIEGFITRGRGITVHTTSCNRKSDVDVDRVIPVEWNSEYKFKHPVNIRVVTHDKQGILSHITKVINNIGINIRSALAKSTPDNKGSFIFEVEVQDYSELIKTVSAIEGVEEVISVTRV